MPDVRDGSSLAFPRREPKLLCCSSVGDTSDEVSLVGIIDYSVLPTSFGGAVQAVKQKLMNTDSRKATLCWNNEMAATYRLSALLLALCVLAGCRLHGNLKRTMISEPASFSEYLAEKTERKRYRRLAEDVYARVNCSDADSVKKRRIRRPSESPYGEGFVDGFVDYMIAGGTVEAPMLPPRKYWNQSHQNASGHRAAHDWFAGFEFGARTARDGGYREVTTIPTLPKYYSHLKYEHNFATVVPFDTRGNRFYQMETPVFYGAMSPPQPFTAQVDEAPSSEHGMEAFTKLAPAREMPPAVHEVASIVESNPASESSAETLVSLPSDADEYLFGQYVQSDLFLAVDPVVRSVKPLDEEIRSAPVLVQPFATKGESRKPVVVASRPKAPVKSDATKAVAGKSPVREGIATAKEERSAVDVKPKAVVVAVPVATGGVSAGRLAQPTRVDGSGQRGSTQDLPAKQSRVTDSKASKRPRTNPIRKSEDKQKPVREQEPREERARPVVKFVETKPSRVSGESEEQPATRFVLRQDENQLRVDPRSVSRVIVRLPEIEQVSFETQSDAE